MNADRLYGERMSEWNQGRPAEADGAKAITSQSVHPCDLWIHRLSCSAAAASSTPATAASSEGAREVSENVEQAKRERGQMQAEPMSEAAQPCILMRRPHCCLFR